MQPTDAFQRLVQELTELRREMELFQKRISHKIDEIKVEVGPEAWDNTFRIACYLAIRDALHKDPPMDFGGDDIEFD